MYYEKIKVISDTHLEFFNNYHKVEKLFAELFKGELQEDLPIISKLFLAGDICSLSPEHIDNLYCFFELLFKHRVCEETYWVFGNHEWYGCDWKDTQYLLSVKDHLYSLAEEWSYDFLFIVEKEPSIVGTRNEVFMSPLWYPDKPDVWLLQNNMNDFSQIANCNPHSFTSLFNKTLDYLLSFTQESRPEYWVFHHLPTYFSIPIQYKTDRLTCYYLGDITKYIQNLQPKMVVHGHSHTPVEYWIGNTLIKSNPIGYPK